MLDDAQFERLSSECEEVLAPFANVAGAIAFEMPALVITARKP